MTEPGAYEKGLARLCEAAEPSYRAFSEKLVPGKRLLGVRIPAVRLVARTCSGDAEEILTEYLSRQDPALEEQLFAGFSLAFAKMPFPRKLEWFRRYIETLDNWSACDSVCAAMKDFRKDPQEGMAFCEKLCRSEQTFSVRAGVVLLLAHYLEGATAEPAVRLLAELSDGRLAGQYYAQIAVAWAVSVRFVREPESTFSLLCTFRDRWIRAKSITKTLESRRLAPQWRERLKSARKELRE